MPHPDERHYQPEHLAKLFAIAGLILLSALMLMFMKDYDRGWKKYQKEFRALEIEKARVKLELEGLELAKNADYQAILEEKKKAQSAVDEQCAKLDPVKAEIESLRAENDLVNQRYRFTKAELDAAKYDYEEAVHNQSPELSQATEIYEALVKKEKKLKLELEKSDTGLKDKQTVLDACAATVKELDRQERRLAKQKYILLRKLEKIDPLHMTFINQIADMVRDFPVIDFANPNYRIEQIVLKDIPDDMIFTQIPRVDRCTTCHLGIANPDYKDLPQPFRTHPNLELYIDKNSPHPIDDFGCTTCHNGRGRGTDFISSAHTPHSAEQAEAWKEKYHWEPLHRWETPMYPKQNTEAGCFKCHAGETVIKGAEKLNLGLNLLERAGCYACHMIEKYEGWPKPGPDLTKLASKFDQNWAYNWIADPRAFRHNTWMPSFFGQSNNNDAESVARSQQEILSMVHVLFNTSTEFKLDEMPNWGDPARGEEIVQSIGCLGCHNVLPEPDREPRTLLKLKKEQGPNLVGLGTKTSKAWLYNWLKDPGRYHPDTRMPSLRLSDQEAADIAAYLTKDKDAEFAGNPIPAVNDDVLNKIVRELLQKTLTEAQAANKIVQMTQDEKLEFAGEKLIAQYGCYSCHNIKGFENFKPIGTELTEEGSKSAEKLDFGFIPIDHTNVAWFTQKLKDPRSFDQGHGRTAEEKLRMPNYYFTDQEIEAIVTALLGFVKEKPEAKIKPRTPRNLYIEEGQKIVREFNCQGCHIIEGKGGAIEPDVINWMVKFDNRAQAEAEALVKSFSAPNLIGEGKKVQTEWLFNFLHSPSIIRPWLKIRMPTYNFHTEHLNTLVKYFNALDNVEFPFSENIDKELSDQALLDAGHKLFSTNYFNCAQCHIVGSQMPSGSPENWAPDFALAKTRLRPQWLSDWIKDPQSLLPGTKMPTYFDPQHFDEAGPQDILDGNENTQIRALRNYLMTLADHPPAPQQPQKPVKTAAPTTNPAEEKAPAAAPQPAEPAAVKDEPSTKSSGI